MTDQIGNFPFWQIQFDETGALVDPPSVKTALQELQAIAPDNLFMFSHGWNNSPPVARGLYNSFFGNLSDVFSRISGGQLPGLGAAKIATVGLYWPSMRWIDETLPTDGVAATAAASIGPGAPAAAAAAASSSDQVLATQERL